MKLNDFIWYEKYRPKTLEDLVLPDAYRDGFEQYVIDGCIPHLLFIGPAGSGKTTIGKALIHHCADTSLILNASSEDRGVGVMKVKVKNFASAKRSTNKKRIILLDEADGLTADAQGALKNTIETYQENCRFIFTANESEKITDPIKSRCVQYSFSKFKGSALIKYLKGILKAENIEFERSDLREVIKMFSPDIRSIINHLQASSVSGTLVFDKFFDAPALKELGSMIRDGDLRSIREMWSVQTDFVWFYKFLFNEFIREVDEDCKSGVGLVVAEYLWRDKTVADREINAAACCLEIMDILEVNVEF